MKAVNEKEFKALIKKYESLTEEMLLDESKEDDSMVDMLNRTTGFGSKRTCTLCNATRVENAIYCNNCIYGIISPSDGKAACLKGTNSETYESIESTDNLTDLLIAIKARAKHMRKVYKSYLKQRS